MKGGRKKGKVSRREKKEGGEKEDFSKAHILENSKLEDLMSLRSLPTRR